MQPFEPHDSTVLMDAGNYSDGNEKLKHIAAQSHALAEQFKKDLVTMGSDGSQNPVVEKAREFSANTVRHLNRTAQFAGQVKQEYAELAEHSRHANIKKNLLTLFGALALGAGGFLLLPPLGLPTMLIVAATVTGGIAGRYVGDTLWMRPVHEKFALFKDQSKAIALQLQQEGNTIEYAEREKLQQLNARIEAITAPPVFPSHVEALQSKRGVSCGHAL